MTHINGICRHIWLDISAVRAHLVLILYGLQSNGIDESILGLGNADCEATYQLMPVLDCMGCTARFHGAVIN